MALASRRTRSSTGAAGVVQRSAIVQLPISALALGSRDAVRKRSHDLETLALDLTDKFETLHKRGCVSHKDFDKVLLESRPDFLLELAASAWPHASLANNSVLLDIGSGTGRFAALAIASGLFAKAHAVEHNSAVAPLSVGAYDADPAVKGRLHVHQYEFGVSIRKQQQNSSKYADLERRILAESDVIFVNNLMFTLDNTCAIGTAIQRFAKRDAVVVSLKNIVELERAKMTRRLQTVFDKPVSSVAKSLEYFVYYLDSYPIMMPPSAFPTMVFAPSAASSSSSSTSSTADRLVSLFDTTNGSQGKAATDDDGDSDEDTAEKDAAFIVADESDDDEDGDKDDDDDGAIVGAAAAVHATDDETPTKLEVVKQQQQPPSPSPKSQPKLSQTDQQSRPTTTSIHSPPFTLAPEDVSDSDSEIVVIVAADPDSESDIFAQI